MEAAKALAVHFKCADQNKSAPETITEPRSAAYAKDHQKRAK